MRTLARARGGAVSPDEMSFFEHLGELRRRLIVAAGVFVVGATVTYIGYNRVLSVLRGPLCRVSPHNCTLFTTSPLEGFGARLDVTAYGGLVIASPVILYELWRFVTPGLKAAERRYAYPFVGASVALFALGAWVAWTTFPHALGFLHAAAGSGVRQLLSPQKYLNLLVALMVIFGLTFEFPVALVGLQLAGAVTPQALARHRRLAIMLIVVAAGVLTPSSDPFSMLAMAVPMLVFYEASILIGRLAAR